MSDQQTPDEWAEQAAVKLGVAHSENVQTRQVEALIECARHLGNIERHLAALVDRADLTRREW